MIDRGKIRVNSHLIIDDGLINGITLGNKIIKPKYYH